MKIITSKNNMLAVAVALLVGGLVVSGSAWAVGCNSWNLTKDSLTYPNQKNPNPDSCGNQDVWQFMQSATLERNPATYSLMTNFNDSVGKSVNDSSIYSWQGDVSYGDGLFTPLIYFSTDQNGHSYSTGLPIPPHAVLVHPAPQRSFVVGWRSPVDGTVSVKGFVRSVDLGSIAWYVDKGANNLASGTVANAVLQNFQDGTNGSNLATVQVQKGEFLYFVIDPNGDYYYDTTQMDITIEAVVSQTDCSDKHAIFDTTKGLLTIPAVDIPTLDPITGEPTGALATFSGQLNLLRGVEDFGLVADSFKVLQTDITAHNPCHAEYIYADGKFSRGGTLHLPYVDVPSIIVIPPNVQVPAPTKTYEATLKQLALDLMIFHISYYQLLTK